MKTWGSGGTAHSPAALRRGEEAPGTHGIGGLDDVA
jgi:hypothetical protein